MWRIVSKDIHIMKFWYLIFSVCFYFLTIGTKEVYLKKRWQWRSESHETWILDWLKIVQRKDKTFNIIKKVFNLFAPIYCVQLLLAYFLFELSMFDILKSFNFVISNRLDQSGPLQCGVQCTQSSTIISLRISSRNRLGFCAQHYARKRIRGAYECAR